MEYTINDFALMAPMKYYDQPNPTTESAKAKRLDMINNKDGLYVATVKHDGDWSMIIIDENDNVLIRSRSISVVTGVYGDYTAKLPHIVEAVKSIFPPSTVILAEICWDEPNTNANTVGTILRCKPAKAVERQKDKKLKAVAFDLLCYASVSLTDSFYIDRIERLNEILTAAQNPYVYCTQIFYEEFLMHSYCVISDGGEGLVIQRRDNSYMPGTRTAWKTLKLKQRMPNMELPVVDTVAPTKEYKGDFLENWSYFIDEKPVTKAYYYGWKNGIVVKYKDTLVSVASGLTDEDKAWLATDEAAKAIQEGKLYAVIGAMSENDLGSLRHPYVLRLRTDVL